MLDGQTFCLEAGSRCLQFKKSIQKRLDLQNLGADVTSQTHQLYRVGLLEQINDVIDPIHADAELVLLEARGNIGMGWGVHVGVQPQGYPGAGIFCLSQGDKGF